MPTSIPISPGPVPPVATAPSAATAAIPLRDSLRSASTSAERLLRLLLSVAIEPTAWLRVLDTSLTVWLVLPKALLIDAIEALTATD